MISQSKKKRLHIMEQIGQRSRDRSIQQNKRQTSAQRRKKIQVNFNDFVHTMHNFPFSHSKSKFSNQSVKFNIGSRFYKQQNNSPSVKDIQPTQSIHQADNIISTQIIKDNENSCKSPQKIQAIQDLAYSKFSEASNTKKQFQNQRDLTVINKKVQQIETQQKLQSLQITPEKIQGKQEEIAYNLSGNSGLSNSRNRSSHTEQLSAIKQQPIQQKQLGQTSKFNNFQIKNQTLSNGEQITVPLNLVTNQNRDDVVSNNSSAIFFTSQFHQFINRQKNKQQQSHEEKSKEKELDHIKELQTNKNYHFDKEEDNQKIQSAEKQKIQTHKRHHTQLEQQENSQSKNMVRNKSGRSIADSNASSLKYSLYQSNVHQMLNYKLTNELVIDANNFLYPAIKILIWADKIQQKQLKTTVEYLKLFTKLWNLKQKVQKREMTDYFQAFLINKQSNFQQKKSQIKANNYLKQKEQFVKIFSFGTLKKYCFTAVVKKQTMSAQFYNNSQISLMQKCFRNIKIGWYNRKVAQEIDMYYLSKIFFHLKKALKKQQAIDRNKVLHFYSKSMKKRFFNYLIQGINNLQSQRVKNQAGEWHYDYSLMKKCMQGWKQKASNQNKFISLAMTTKNAFKETEDHRWMQIRTVDFRQLK